MNETENNTNIESEEKLNDDLFSNKPADSDSDMGNSGLMEENEKPSLVGTDSDNMLGGTDIYKISNGSTGAQSEPPAENTDVSDGNAAHMEGHADVETGVSDGDLFYIGSPVSAGDTYNTYYYSCSCGDGYESPFTKEDVSHISGTLDALLLTASGILFFILFAWAEKKIGNGIRKMFHRMKAD